MLKIPRILIIEDDPDHTDLILNAFEGENIDSNITFINDGMDAIDYLGIIYSANQEVQSDINSDNGRYSQIDLVILDLNLPKVDGMGILRLFKNNSRYSSIPIVILSTSSNQETISEAYANGANGYITKHISYDKFVGEIKQLRKYWTDIDRLPNKQNYSETTKLPSKIGY